MRARVKEKDALDILRLLQAVDTADLVAGLRRHLDHDSASNVTTRGMSFLKEHGMTPTSRLATFATAAATGRPNCSSQLRGPHTGAA
jgi:capsule polysaccharide export protein KpsC/LpsZ